MFVTGPTRTVKVRYLPPRLVSGTGPTRQDLEPRTRGGTKLGTVPVGTGPYPVPWTRLPWTRRGSPIPARQRLIAQLCLYDETYAESRADSRLLLG